MVGLALAKSRNMWPESPIGTPIRDLPMAEAMAVLAYEHFLNEAR